MPTVSGDIEIFNNHTSKLPYISAFPLILSYDDDPGNPSIVSASPTRSPHFFEGPILFFSLVGVFLVLHSFIVLSYIDKVWDVPWDFYRHILVSNVRGPFVEFFSDGVPFLDSFGSLFAQW